MTTSPTNRKQVLFVVGGFIVLYITILIINVALGVGPNLLMKWMNVPPGFRAFIGSTFSYGLRLAAYTVLPALALQKVLGVNSWTLFFPPLRHYWKEILLGFLLVSGVLTVFFLVEVRVGWLALDGWNWRVIPGDVWLRAAWVGFLVNICVAVGEETLFRGYLLTALNMLWGRWQALLVMMVTFGLFHLAAYIETGFHSITLVLAILLATLFGGLFGLVYLRTKALWLSIVLHFTWNFIENDLLNLTGDMGNVNLVGALTRLREPLTTTNIIFIEASAFSFIALGLWLWLRIKNKPEIENAPLQ